LLHISCNFVTGSGSGGYAENVLTYAAEHILNTRLDRIVFEAQKNPDLREVTVKSEAGDTVLRFAIANGFRNIQNLVQKMKRKRCDYDLVEIMACPSGCLNGGAQLRQGHEWCNACLVPDRCVLEQKVSDVPLLGQLSSYDSFLGRSLRIRDVYYPQSEFFRPGSRIKNILDPGSGSASIGLWIRNDLFRIRLLRKFRLRLRSRILFRIRQRWSPPREGCAANAHFIRKITTIHKVFLNRNQCLLKQKIFIYIKLIVHLVE
jgi:hypothetical protein